MNPTEELLTRWTIRLALVCYVAVLSGQIAVPGGIARWQRAARLLWTVGCLFFLAHVACAFQFYHGWSHARVLEDTARQTEDLLGWKFGEGIYFSYLFTLLWAADVLWWWLCPACYLGRPKWITYAVHGFMFFIAFNGAVVFEDGITRWWGIATSVALAALLAWRALKWGRHPACQNRSRLPGGTS